MDARDQAWNTFRQALVLWCLANVLPLTTAEGAVWSAAVHFEHLVADGQPEWTRLAESLGIRVRHANLSVRAASASDYRRRGAVARDDSEIDTDRVAGWRRTISDQDLGFGLAMLRNLGLDRIYGEDPLPRSSAKGLPCRS